MEKTILISFKVDKGLKKELEAAAIKTRQSQSRLIREALVKEINRIKGE